MRTRLRPTTPDRTTSAVVIIACCAILAGVVIGIGIRWGTDAGRSAAAERKVALLDQIGAEVRDAAEILSALPGTPGKPLTPPDPESVEMILRHVGYRVLAVPLEWENPALLAVERIEHEQGREKEALARYRDLASDRSLPDPVRAMSLWNQARLERSRGRGHEARRLLEAAAKIEGLTEGARLRIEFDLSIATGKRSALITALEGGFSGPGEPRASQRFSSVPPRDRAILHQRLGGEPEARRGLWILAAALARGPGPVDQAIVRVEVESDQPILGYVRGVTTTEVAVAVGEEEMVLARLLPSIERGQARLAEPSELTFRLDPLPRAVGLGAASVASLQAAYEEAWWGRMLLVLGLGLLLSIVGMRIAWMIRKQRTSADQQRDFVAAVTHELKTPLSNILLYSETLREAGTDDPAVVPQFARTIQDEAERLRVRIQQVLDVASGRRQATPDDPTFDPAELAEAVAADYQKGALDRGMRIAVARAEHCPRIHGDPELLAQALGVLLDNAIRYAGHGTVSIVVRATGERVAIWVRDQGAGILDRDRERVFEPFVRLGAELTRSNPGTGLGLGLARQCVEQLGGRLDMDDERDDGKAASGASFKIQLPVNPEDER